MEKIKKSQILKLLLIATLLLLTPLLSPSQRTPYLYFIVNLLIIALSAEAGLVSFFSDPSNDKKPRTTSVKQQQHIIGPSVTRVVEKCASEKIVSTTTTVETDKLKLQKCPSTPSLFFIGGGHEDSDQAKDDDEEKEEMLGELSGQELFNKAETFIGNFYKQLKMQKEGTFE